LEATVREDQEREEAAQKLKAAAAQEIARVQDVVRRRSSFGAGAVHALPTDGESQAMIKFRAPNGSTIQRKFSDSTQVSVLFEFALVADWGASVGSRTFDLKTSFPTRSLRGLEQQTLREAELCPSTMLLLIYDDA